MKIWCKQALSARDKTLSKVRRRGMRVLGGRRPAASWGVSKASAFVICYDVGSLGVVMHVILASSRSK